MDIKDIGAWVTVAGIVGGAIFGVWKKIFKPLWRAYLQYNNIVANDARVVALRYKIGSLMRLSNTCFFEADITGGWIDANQCLIDLFGAHNESELLGYGFTSFIVKEERQYFRSDYQNSIERDTETTKFCQIENRETREIIRCSIDVCINRSGNKLINIIGKVTVIK